MSNTRLIVGLGNPGKGYEFTRHNLGFLVVQHMVEQLRIKFALSSFSNGLTAEGTHEGREVCCLMPLTYMNNSGAAVTQAVNVKKVGLDNILVICDDLNLDFGQMRIRPKGSDGGNNGLTSIIERLGTENFARLRLGIGKPKSKDDMIDYVLEEFNKREKKQLSSFVAQAAECGLVWIKEGIGKAMDQFNRKTGAS